MTKILEKKDIQNLEKLTNLIRHFSIQGQTPATSGNFSLRSNFNKNTIYISESGILKNFFKQENLIPANLESGKPLSPFCHKKISYEAGIHFEIYKQIKNAHCVLHTHMLEALLVYSKGQELIEITDFEIVKAFPGVTSHLATLQIPVIENSQDINDICIKWLPLLRKFPNHYGFIIKNHGIYCWGDSVESAQKHIEAFEYIFKFLNFKSLKGLNN